MPIVLQLNKYITATEVNIVVILGQNAKSNDWLTVRMPEEDLWGSDGILFLDLHSLLLEFLQGDNSLSYKLMVYEFLSMRVML